jgi:IS30 family transposase
VSSPLAQVEEREGISRALVAGESVRSIATRLHRAPSTISRAMRRSRHHTQKTDNHGQISDMVSISERPAEAEDLNRPGFIGGSQS